MFNTSLFLYRSNTNVNYLLLSLSAALRYTFGTNNNRHTHQITSVRLYSTNKKKTLKIHTMLYKGSNIFSFCSCIDNNSRTLYNVNNSLNIQYSSNFSRLCRTVGTEICNSACNNVGRLYIKSLSHSLINDCFNNYKHQIGYLISSDFITTFFVLNLFNIFIFRTFQYSVFKSFTFTYFSSSTNYVLSLYENNINNNNIRLDTLYSNNLIGTILLFLNINNNSLNNFFFFNLRSYNINSYYSSKPTLVGKTLQGVPIAFDIFNGVSTSNLLSNGIDSLDGIFFYGAVKRTFCHKIYYNSNWILSSFFPSLPRVICHIFFIFNIYFFNFSHRIRLYRYNYLLRRRRNYNGILKYLLDYKKYSKNFSGFVSSLVK